MFGFACFLGETQPERLPEVVLSDRPDRVQVPPGAPINLLQFKAFRRPGTEDATVQPVLS